MTGVDGKFESIETRMPFGVGILVVKHGAFYEELTHVSSVALHFFESLDGGPGRSSAEMQEIGQFLLVKGLYFGPEPFNHFVFGIKLSLVIGILSPVLHINVGHSIEDHFEFIGFKNTN